jgi:hypothetical protein
LIMPTSTQNPDLTPDERDGYLEALLSVVTADGVLDPDEVIKIYELFSLLGIGVVKRRSIIEDLVAQAENFGSASISKSILANEALKISLAKDLTLLRDRSSDNNAKRVAREYLEKINLSPDQAEVIGKFIAIENQILASLGAGEEWIADEKSWKELVSRAAAVGVPLAALNIAGVAGFSAVGITSGLAALGGMSGLVVLGLNPMTAGIGALILGGVAVKKIADYVLASEDTEKVSQLEAYKKARAEAKEAIAADLPVVAKERTSELIRPKVRHRRSVLRSSMNSAIALLAN